MEERKKGRKEERKKGRKEERRKGGKEERKKGGKEERKKGRKEERRMGERRDFRRNRAGGPVPSSSTPLINPRNLRLYLPLPGRLRLRIQPVPRFAVVFFLLLIHFTEGFQKLELDLTVVVFDGQV